MELPKFTTGYVNLYSSIRLREPSASINRFRIGPDHGGWGRDSGMVEAKCLGRYGGGIHR